MWKVSLSLLALYLLLVPGAQAHKLLVAAMVEDRGALTCQAFFPDGNPAQEVSISIIPEDGQHPALTGKTDAQGICRFASVPPGNYRVVAGDLMGHRAETRVAIKGAAATGAPTPSGSGPPAAASPGTGMPSRGEPLPWRDILAGLGFIFGLTALLMAIKIWMEMKKHASRD